jgi:4-hydroxyphenylpyruvate dioxygenase
MSALNGIPIEAIDHLHFFCGNARQAAHFYRSAFGFRLTAYSGPETGVRDIASYCLEQGHIRFVLSTPLSPDHAASAWLRQHGDGVRSIAFTVRDAGEAWRQSVARGAEAHSAPVELADEHGVLRVASIHTYGDVLHSFIERHAYAEGRFGPHFQPVPEPDLVARPVGLRAIDHIVGNVGWNEMNRWAAWYEKVLGFSVFQHFDDKDISTEYSALMSKVLASGNGRIKFPINEPAEGRRKSQIEEYLDYNHGPGVQHIAMLTADIVDTVTRLQAQGVDFLRVPTAYYQELQARVGTIDEPVDELARLGILVDRDDEGYLLQIFTRPVEDRPTLFFEIIQRKGSRSFGKGNFKALFEAIEREQELRGNL